MKDKKLKRKIAINEFTFLTKISFYSFGIKIDLINRETGIYKLTARFWHPINWLITLLVFWDTLYAQGLMYCFQLNLKDFFKNGIELEVYNKFILND